MAVELFLADLVSSSQVDVLTDEHDATFQRLMQRWTDIDKRTPYAIICPASEADIQKVVQSAVRAAVPFVINAGGHSHWSTIGRDGVIIDLCHYSDVEYDRSALTATLKGSVLSKEVAVCLAAHGRCTALGNGNTVGAIGYFLGGGVSITTSATGYGAQQIVAARLITAEGELVEVSKTSNRDLLWALRGAGHFFGVVTQLTITTLPLSVLGTDRGVIWAGMFVFPLDRAPEVCKAMGLIMNNDKYATSGLMMIMAPPPNRQPSLMISARMTGDPADAKHAYEALYKLKPLAAPGGEIPVQNASDARAALGAKGEFKQFSIVGLHAFDEDAFLETVEIWKEMVSACPDSINSAYNFQWDSRFAPAATMDCAMSLTDIRFWQNNLIWHTDAANRAEVEKYARKCIDAVRVGVNGDDPVDYVNCTRMDPIQHRFRGAGRLDRLKALKKIWDPHGRFTQQLL